MSLQLPHISRFISATAISVFRELSLWGILTALIAYNSAIALSSPPVGFQQLLVAVMQPTASSAAHIKLAQWYRQNGIFDKAKQELLLASEGSAVLGAQANPRDILAAWENEPARLEQAYHFWQGVIREKPDYRDAYVALAALGYQLGYTEETKKYIGNIQTIDPGFPIYQEFATLIQ